jgi:hypothetical protein
MNVHLKPLSFKKYSLTLIYTFLFIGLMISWMEIYFERIYGDLTRLGNFPERYFGWQYPQPSISPDLFKDYSFNEADILVIGDSFSIGRTWQTKLVSEGLKVGTMHWGELKTKSEAMPSDLGNALRTSGFKGRYVVIESVGRLSLMAVIFSLIGCVIMPFLLMVTLKKELLLLLTMYLRLIKVCNNLAYNLYG